MYRYHDVTKEDFVNSVKEYICSNNHKKNHAIVGDFNINLLAADNLTEDFLSNFLDRGYMPYFNGITRPNESGGTCIDNFFIKSNFCNLISFTYTNRFTDHYPIFVCLKSSRINLSNNKCNNDNNPTNTIYKLFF